MSFEIQNAVDLIPQGIPFVFVDKLIYIDDKTSHGVFKIPAENIFVKSGFYSASGMVESMAQTAAAGTGYLSKKNHNNYTTAGDISEHSFPYSGNNPATFLQ